MSHNHDAPKDDLRVRRTQKLLQTAFIELVIEEGFEAITVQMLAERAMINRATFYRHYEDKYDLAEKVYVALTTEYVASIQEVTNDNLQSGWLLLMEHIATYADFYLAMLAGMPSFRDRVRDGIEQQLLIEFQRLGLDEARVELPLPLILRYLAAAQMGVIQWWLEAGKPVTAEEMARHLFQLHLHGGMQSLNLKTTLTAPRG